jgi:large repetitive protein
MPRPGPRTTRTSLIGLLAVLGGWTPSQAAPAEAFQPIGNMTAPRAGAQLTLLTDGMVLVTGGGDKSAELFDPKSNQFTPLPPTAALRDHAVRLQDGQVLLTGGTSADGKTPRPSAEVFNPVTQVFTPGGTMNQAREGYTLSLLPDGRVLVAGGWNSATQKPVATAELYDPASGTFQEIGKLAAARFSHAAVSLPDGRVVLMGGYSGNEQTLRSTEIYDPKTGVFDPQGELVEPRGDQAATLLPDGRILLVGGVYYTRGGGQVKKGVEIYDVTTGQSVAIGAMKDARVYHTTIPLADGRVLVVGGENERGLLQTAELIDVATGAVSPTEKPTTGRTSAAGILLADQRALIVGGVGPNREALASAEVFIPAGSSAAVPQ